MTSRIPSSPSYQEHWPSMLSHSRATQQQSSEHSKPDFGQTFREQLSSNDENSAPAKSVPTSAQQRANQEPRDQTPPVLKSAPDDPQQALAHTAPKTSIPTKAAAPPVSFGDNKTPFETKASGNASSNANKEARRPSSRSQSESGDSQSDLTALPNGLQIAPVAADQDEGEQGQADTDSSKHEVHESKQIDATGSSGSNPIQGDLALAMRISATSSDASQSGGENEAPDVTSVQASTAIQHNQTQVTGMAASQQRHEADSTPRTAGTVTATQPGSLRETEKPAQAEEGKSTHSADFEAEFNKFRSEPVRGAHVQITGAENQRVDIRLQERAGTLSVSVRSNDSSLAKTLQDHSPELNTRLSAEHFRTELWTPSLNKTPQERGSNTNSGQGQQQGDAQREQGQGRKNRQNHTPEWIAEFENDPAASQKRIEYTWHQ